MSAEERSPGPSKVGRAAVVVLPTFSVLVAALVFLGPGGARSVVGARVHGAPFVGGRVVALRLEVVRALYEVLDSGGAHELLVEASAPGQTLRAWHGSTGPDGIAEVRLEASAPLQGPLALAVTALAPKQRVLAAGEVALAPGALAVTPTVETAQVVGVTKGDLDVRVQATRGLLAAPFADAMRVIVSPGQRTKVHVTGAGLDPPSANTTTDENGIAVVEVTPLAHQIELQVNVRGRVKAAHWEGTLPIVPGAIWLRPGRDTGARALVSPAPKERAYVSFWSDEGRVGGAVVPLAKDSHGFHAGMVDLPNAPGARVLVATVAGDPLEQGAGTVTWPIRPAEGAAAAPRMTLLLDGLPAAQQREKERASAARRAGLALIGAAAIAEALLLVALGRSSQRRLEAHLTEASAAMPAEDRARLLGAARERPWLRAVLAVSLVGLAFALVAALSSFR